MPYVAPTPSDLRARYPAFAAIDDAAIQPFLDQANGGDVDQSWTDRDFAPAIMAAAAHRMSRAGILRTGGAIDASAGVDSFRSGSMSVQFNSAAVAAQVAGGWSSTNYGQDYLDLLARNRGGPRVVGGGGVAYCDGFNGWAGPLPGWQL